MEKSDSLNKEVIDNLNSITGNAYTLYHPRNIGYLYVIISFLIMSIVFNTKSFISLFGGICFGVSLFIDGCEFSKMDLEYLYMLNLSANKKKSALLLDIITQFFHNESLYVEFESVEDGNIILKATFYDYNGNSNVINYPKNYNVTKGKKYKIADLIK